MVLTGCGTTAENIRFGVDGYNHGSPKDVLKIIFKDSVGSKVAPEHLAQLKVLPQNRSDPQQTHVDPDRKQGDSFKSGDS